MEGSLLPGNSKNNQTRCLAWPPPIYRRVYVEIVTREDLATRQSIENLTFQLCEGLMHHTALVQLHIVDRSESLAKLAAGTDLISKVHRVEAPYAGSSGNLGHAARLYSACTALNPSQEPV